MSIDYQVQCDCGTVKLAMTGKPRVHAFCHCEDCRELLDVPYHSIAAWEGDKLSISAGEDRTGTYQHPELAMTRVFCKECGETLYNTNMMGWKLVSQLLIRKRNGGELPVELASAAHFFYDRRIVNIDDTLPKS